MPCGNKKTKWNHYLVCMHSSPRCWWVCDELTTPSLASGVEFDKIYSSNVESCWQSALQASAKWFIVGMTKNCTEGRKTHPDDRKFIFIAKPNGLSSSCERFNYATSKVIERKCTFHAWFILGTENWSSTRIPSVEAMLKSFSFEAFPLDKDNDFSSWCQKKNFFSSRTPRKRLEALITTKNDWSEKKKNQEMQ